MDIENINLEEYNTIDARIYPNVSKIYHINVRIRKLPDESHGKVVYSISNKLGAPIACVCSENFEILKESESIRFDELFSNGVIYKG